MTCTYVHLKKLTNEREGSRKRNFDAASVIMFRISTCKCFQKRQQKPQLIFSLIGSKNTHDPVPLNVVRRSARVFVRQEKCPDMGFIGHALLAFDLLITACPASGGKAW
jgi:hypothetical protein